jgi:acetylornithine/succinyldiaminopimelate/putrescine aminotransferase
MKDRSDAEKAALRRMDDGWTASDPPTTFVESAIKVALEMADEATAAERDRCAEIVREFHGRTPALAAIEGGAK